MGRAKGSRNPPGSAKPGPKPGKKCGEDVYAMTLDAVGQEFGLTRERIRQIEAKALAKLRAALEERGIDESLWLDHLRDLHKRQRTAYSVSGAHVAASRFRSVDEAEEAASCNVATAE
jgi:hypothetical protein